MRKLTYGLLALAAGFMVQGLSPTTAQALEVPKAGVSAPHAGVMQVRHAAQPRGHFRAGPRFYGGGGKHFYGGHRFHRRHFFGPRIYFGSNYYRYNNGCYWLKRKALRTGSRYWWHRYWECRNGY